MAGLRWQCRARSVRPRDTDRDRVSGVGAPGYARSCFASRRRRCEPASSWLVAALGVVALRARLPPMREGSAGVSSPGFRRSSREQGAVRLQRRVSQPRRDLRRSAATCCIETRWASSKRCVALRTRGRYRADTVQCGLPARSCSSQDDTHGTLFAGEACSDDEALCAQRRLRAVPAQGVLGYRIKRAASKIYVCASALTIGFAGRDEPLDTYAFLHGASSRSRGATGCGSR